MLAGLRLEQCRLGAKLPLQGLSQQDHQATPPASAAVRRLDAPRQQLEQ